MVTYGAPEWEAKANEKLTTAEPRSSVAKGVALRRGWAYDVVTEAR